MRKSRAGKFKMIHIILNFPALDFLVPKINEREFQKYFCCSLPYFYIYPGIDEEEEDCINASQELYLFGEKYIVESSSALCYGLEEAMKRFISSLIYDNYKDHNKTLQTSIINPCLSQDLAQYSTVSFFCQKKSEYPLGFQIFF